MLQSARWLRRFRRFSIESAGFQNSPQLLGCKLHNRMSEERVVVARKNVNAQASARQGRPAFHRAWLLSSVPIWGHHERDLPGILPRFVPDERPKDCPVLLPDLIELRQVNILRYDIRLLQLFQLEIKLFLQDKRFFHRGRTRHRSKVFYEAGEQFFLVNGAVAFFREGQAIEQHKKSYLVALTPKFLRHFLRHNSTY